VPSTKQKGHPLPMLLMLMPYARIPCKKASNQKLKRAVCAFWLRIGKTLAQQLSLVCKENQIEDFKKEVMVVDKAQQLFDLKIVVCHF